MSTNKHPSVVISVPTRKFVQPSPTRKRLTFDHEENFNEPLTPKRKPTSSKLLLDHFEDLSSVETSGFNDSLISTSSNLNTPQNITNTSISGLPTPNYMDFGPRPSGRLSPPLSPAPKMCPPTPSPNRSVRRDLKRVKLTLPLMEDFSGETSSSKSLSQKHHEISELLPPHLDLPSTWTEPHEEAPVPRITFSSPPSTPPSSPANNAHGTHTSVCLAPPPCNINPFSPEKPKLEAHQSLQEEYSPVITQYITRYTCDYEEIAQIGSGCFGSVYKCRDRIDGWVYAIKISKKKFRGPIERQNLLKEAYALAALGTHENVVRYYGSWIEDDQLYIKTEYCGGGSLSSLFENGTVFTESQLCDALRQVSLGLAHIHERNFVHLDIKPENIYVSESEQRIFKIGDFGLLSNADTRRDIEEGDCRYLPKELLSTEDVPVLTKADIFSLGCSIYELALHKSLPKTGEEWRQVREGHLSLPPSFSKEFEDLLKHMMHPDPEVRPSAIEMLQHPLLSTQEERFKLKQKTKVKELKHFNEELKIKVAVLENELKKRNESDALMERMKSMELMLAGLMQQNAGNRPPTAN